METAYVKAEMFAIRLYIKAPLCFLTWIGWENTRRLGKKRANGTAMTDSYPQKPLRIAFFLNENRQTYNYNNIYIYIY